MPLIFIGPPGVGKGTQAKLVKEYFSIVHLSTGDILRSEIFQATPLGIKAKYYIDKGHLVPDNELLNICLLYTSPSPRDGLLSRMPSSA